MLYKTLNMVKYDFSRSEVLRHTIMYSVIGFFLPFFIGHPQWLVGALVNSILIMTALNLRKYALLPIVMLPSLGVLSRGLIFGPFTVFLVYFIPLIWISNLLLIFLFKWLNLDRKLNYFITLILSASAKTAFLFMSALVLVKLGLVPVIFLTAMGFMQFITATAGGIVAFTVLKLEKRINL